VNKSDSDDFVEAVEPQASAPIVAFTTPQIPVVANQALDPSVESHEPLAATCSTAPVPAIVPRRQTNLGQFFRSTTREEHIEQMRREFQICREEAEETARLHEEDRKLTELEKQARIREGNRVRKQAQRAREKMAVCAMLL
jgi:hypothetical protein